MLLILWVIYPSNCDYKDNGSHFVVPLYFYHVTIKSFGLVEESLTFFDSEPSTCIVAAKFQKSMKKDSSRLAAVAGEQWSTS